MGARPPRQHAGQLVIAAAPLLNMMRSTLLLALLVAGLCLSTGCAGLSQEKLDNYLAWVDAQGVETELTVDFIDENTGYGLVSKRAFKEGETILSVPRSAMCSSEVALTELSSLFQHYAGDDHVLEISGDLQVVALAFWSIIEQKKPNSPWKPFLDAQPTEFPSLPYYWSDSEKKELQGTGLDVVVEQTISEHKEAFTFMKDNFITPLGVKELEDTTFDEFFRAVQVFRSRGFHGMTCLPSGLSHAVWADGVSQTIPAWSSSQWLTS